MSSYYISIFTVLMILVGEHTSLGQTKIRQPRGTRVKVISAGRCYDEREINYKKDNGPSCRSMREYWKCHARLLIVKWGADSITARWLQTSLNSETALLGQPCNINAQTMRNEILQERRDGIVWDTVNIAPPGFDNATTIGGCLDTRNAEVEQAGDLNCNIDRQFMKCRFRVLELHKSQLSNQGIQQIENEIEADLRKDGLFCDLEVHEMLRDLQKGDQPVTTPAPPGSTVQVISFGRCFDNLKSNEKRDRGPSCRSEREDWKCHMRLDFADFGEDDRFVGEIQFEIDAYLKRLHLSCNISAHKIKEELLQEKRSGIVWKIESTPPAEHTSPGQTSTRQPPGEATSPGQNSTHQPPDLAISRGPGTGDVTKAPGNAAAPGLNLFHFNYVALCLFSLFSLL